MPARGSPTHNHLEEGIVKRLHRNEPQLMNVMWIPNMTPGPVASHAKGSPENFYLYNLSVFVWQPAKVFSKLVDMNSLKCC